MNKKITTKLIRTSNIIINKENIDYEKLKKEFILYKCLVPKFSSLQGDYKFGRFHNDYKSMLDIPYYFYSYDSPPALYILDSNQVPSVIEKNLIFEKSKINGTLEQIDFTKIPLHVALKLLLANYIYIESRKNKIVSQSKIYVLAKLEEKNRFKALKIDLKGYVNNNENNLEQEYHLISESKNFYKEDKTKIQEHFLEFVPYYEQSGRENFFYLRQLKPQEVLSSNMIFVSWQKKTSPAKLDWFSILDDKFEESRSYILYNLQKKFCEYLNTYLSIKSKNSVFPKERNFIQVQPKYQEYPLRINDLQTIYLYDARQRGEDKKIFNRVPFSECLSLFQKLSEGKNIKFVQFNESVQHEPVLLIQDVDKEAFKEGNVLKKANFSDNYRTLKNQFKSSPNQFININLNEHKNYESAEAYLNYDFAYSGENYH